jgi:hypothetical protein
MILDECDEKEDQGKVKREVEVGPQLLRPSRKMTFFHPVRVDEEEKV